MDSRDLIKVNDYDGMGTLWRLEGPTSEGAAILITHGTFSTAETCLPLARYLGDSGRTVYVIEWRGRDAAPGQVPRFDFFDLARDEISQAIAHIGTAQGLHMVAHSGGGLAMILALLNAPAAQVRSLTMVATQTTHLHHSPLPARLAMHAISLWGRHSGYWPVRLLRIGTCNESAALLQQWLDWNSAGTMYDPDGMDVMPRLEALGLPVLAVAGRADRIIAPEPGCRALCAAFGASGEYLLVGRSEGFAEDFTHQRLWRSRAAKAEVWPRIAEFMDRYG